MGDADRAVVWLVARSAWLGTAVVAVAVGVVFYLGLTGSSAENMVDVSQIRVIAENPAVRALYGRPLEVPSPGTFIVWRYGQVVTLFSAIWVVLLTTRTLRGEEEVGRWDLVLAAGIARRRLTTLVLGVVVAAAAVVSGALFVAFVSAGERPGGAMLFSVGFGLVLVTFVGVAAVASQVFVQRRRAAGLAGAAVGGAFLVRMVADGTTGLGGIGWTTPFGWLEEVEPFASDEVLPLGLLVGAAAGLLALAAALTGRRDVGDGLVRDSGRAPARLTLLQSPLGFAWRSRLGGLLGWSAGIAALGVVAGGITSAFADFIATHPGFPAIAADYGFEALVSAEGFVGTIAALTGVVLAFYAIVSVRGLWDDEASGRLELVFVAPVTRMRWLAGGVITSLAAVLVATFVAMVTMSAGIALGGAAVTGRDTAAGVANTLPVVALFFGMAVLLHGLWPEWATALSGGAAAAAYVVSFIGPALDWPAAVLALSPFDHLAVVPAEPVDWAAAAVMLGTALVCTGVGFVGYARRDLR